MPSSITLTVSHLPTSTSFFLSALQPLDYVYRGRAGQTIGFGSALDKNSPADFWITQEVPGVPAGAAHVAFSASSRAAVQDFFVAALKAGGRIHGEPCVRDASGYFSGAVIDFDGNSIEAVYRPSFSDDKENDTKSMVSRRSSVKAPSTVAKSTTSRPPSSVARSSVSQTPSRAPSVRSAAAAPPQQAISGDVIDKLFTEARNVADVARNLVGQVREHNNSQPQTQTTDGGNVLATTILGVAAGAALHYAFTNNSNGNRPAAAERSRTEPPSPQSEFSGYSQSRRSRAIEAPPSSYYHPKMITMHDNNASISGGSTIRPRRSSSVGHSTTSRRTSTRMIEAAPAAPPTSYKAPTALTTTSSRRSGGGGGDDRASTASQSRRRSHSQASSDRTIVRVAETVTAAARRTPLPESAAGSRTAPGSRTTSRRSSRNASPARYPLPASTKTSVVGGGGSKASSARTAIRDREPEEYPLSMSRASTWTAGGGGSKASKSVIGKVKETRKLDLPKGELTPDDSVSQISVSRGSERSRRSRR